MALYRVCLSQTIAYLRTLQASGRILPVEKSKRENPLADLACDLLGGLLQSRDDAPYFIVFDYFKRHGVVDFESADPEEIYWRFSVLMRGYIKKELSRMPGDRDPQTDLLKRRFKDILRGPEYGDFIAPDGKSRCVHLADNRDNLRPDNPPISVDELERLVAEAFADSNNRREWCRKCFQMLNRMTEYQNFVRLSDLLTEVIKVNSEHLELYCGPGFHPSAEDAVTEDMLAQAREQAIVYIKNHSLRRFLRQGRLTDNEAEKLIVAVEHYLTDMAQNGNPDPIPEYFRLVMPKSQHRFYLKRYKYFFETVINEALEEFRRFLRE